jgi:hypothetical protein
MTKIDRKKNQSEAGKHDQTYRGLEIENEFFIIHWLM